MQRVILMLFAALLMVSCNRSASNEDQGRDVEKIVSATIEEMLSAPDDYNGRVVAISGLVTHVCRHGGQKCFVLGDDGETQLRIVPGGDIDEFKISLEGSTVAFKGVFRVLNPVEARAHVEDHDSKEHHSVEMAHSQAEKADYFIEASEFKEITR